MSRSLSSAMLQALAAQETGEAPLVLLTIEHADLPAPIRVSSNAVATVSNGQNYLPFPFHLSLPDDRDDRPPTTTLTIDNVSREIVAALRTITSPPTVTMQVVLASQPNTVEAVATWTLLSATYDMATVSGELGEEDILNQRFPADDFTPASHPGLF